MTILLAAHTIAHVNASLNATATVLLLVGLYLIKNGRVEAHKRTMLAAFAVSTAFLACYIWYHLHVGSVRFTHPGAIRYVYLTILASHVLLAITVPFLAIRQIYLGYRALGCCAGDCPLFSRRSHTPSIHVDREKGTVPLGTQRPKGVSPLFAVEHSAAADVPPRKKGTDPAAAAYREKHRRLARVTFPIWLYVSVTGVIVYAMLYHLWPPIEQ